MGLSIGIVGLPNVGKSTLFNAITKAGAQAANYPFCTIEPNVGVVDLPDPRLQQLAEIVQPQRIVPAAVTFIDIAGIVRGASKGEGLGNKFLAHIRDVDAIAHVVRCFAGTDVTHVEGDVDPLRDIETINLELILADLETVQRRAERVARQVKTGEKRALAEQALIEKLQAAFDKGLPARSVELTDEERQIIREYHLITMKPVMYVANLAEHEVADPTASSYYNQVAEVAAREGAEVVPVSAQIEAELAEMADDERAAFLEDLGLAESGLDRVIRTGFALLGLITYFTAGVQEVRAWTIRRGTRAPRAAGEIHSDIERGFIRAEVIAFEDLIAAGKESVAKEQGKMRLEGKEYVMQDGDVVHFRFNV